MKDRNNKNSKSDAWHMGQGIPSVPVRPQKPRDGYGYGGGTFTPGKFPPGCFQAVWNFSDRPFDYKNSPVSKPEKGEV